MEKRIGLDWRCKHRCLRQSSWVGRGLGLFGLGLSMAFAVALSGCTIAIVSGPSTVSVGEIVTYVTEVGSSDGDAKVLLYFAADVPPGWELISASFKGTLDGIPTVFEAVPAGANSCGSLPPTGLQAYRFQAGPFDFASPDDTGTATLTFDVRSQPEEEFKIYFYFGAFGEGGGACSTPAVRTINRQRESFVQFREAHFTGTDTGMLFGGGVAVAPDGRHVYAAFYDNDSLSVFARDPSSGGLELLEILFDDTGGVDGLDGAGGVVVSPDSRFVYVTSILDDSLAIFARDLDSGELIFEGALYDGVDGVAGLDAAGGIALSPDGLYLYVIAGGEDSIAAFARDPASGEPSFVQVLYDGMGGVDGLERPNGLAVSPDGRHLYVSASGDDSIAAFARDATSGELAFVAVIKRGDEGIEGLGDARAVAITPDGAHVYVVSQERLSQERGAVAVFARDTVTGELTWIEAHFNRTDVVGVELASGVAVSRDGGHVFVTGENAVTTFVRRPGSGRLTLLEAQFEGDPPEQTGLENTLGLAIIADRPDAADVYVASEDDFAVAAFRTSPAIFADGFESGDTTRWSETGP